MGAATRFMEGGHRWKAETPSPGTGGRTHHQGSGPNIQDLGGKDMAEKVDQTLVNDLMKCAISMSAFDTEHDLNMRLSHLQQINKEYNSFVNKLGSESITVNDLEMAAPEAKSGLDVEIQRRSDLQLDDTGREQLARSSKGKVGQIVNFLQQDRTMEINISLNFNRPEPEGSEE